MGTQPKERKCIVLVDWRQTGHHPTFFNYFLIALQDLGYDVLALCPDPEAAERRALRFREFSSADLGGRGQVQFVKVGELVGRLRWLWPRRIGVFYSRVRRFWELERQVREESQREGWEVGAIFYSCIYDHDFDVFRYARPFMKTPWIGLYLFCDAFRTPGKVRPDTGRVSRPNRIFAGKNCRGLGIFDEGILEEVSTHLRKPVVRIPDLAELLEVESHENLELVESLRTFAAGRPIIGLFGHLQRSKGMLTFLKAVSLADPDKLCFAMAGEVTWPADEREEFEARTLIARCSSLWTHLERIPSDAVFAALMDACDVISASYIDFSYSSNILAKAAVGKKPVIVSKGYLMAERVRRFGTGEIVDQEDAEEFLAAVRRITDNPKEWLADNCPRWEDYQEEHSFLCMKRSIGDLVGRAIG